MWALIRRHGWHTVARSMRAFLRGSAVAFMVGGFHWGPDMKNPRAPRALRFVPRLVGGAEWRCGVGALLAVCGVLLGCGENSAQTDAGEGGTPATMADEGTPATTADAIPSSPMGATEYDQCMVDSDCVAVGEVAPCPASACDGSDCNCPCESGAICRAGKCQAAFCGPDPSDTLPTCADVGGRCAYSANTTCPAVGPAGSCAFSDEFCCLSSPYDAGPDADVDAQADASPRDAGLE